MRAESSEDEEDDVEDAEDDVEDVEEEREDLGIGGCSPDCEEALVVECWLWCSLGIWQKAHAPRTDIFFLVSVRNGLSIVELGCPWIVWNNCWLCLCGFAF